MAFVTPLLSSAFTPRISRTAPPRRQITRVTVMSAASSIPDVLVSILERKKTEVEALRTELESAGEDHPVTKVLAAKGSLPREKKFFKALNLPAGSLTVIAEVKRRSPSKGKIGDIPDAGLLSRVYYEGGASAVSVLTDLEGFGGTMDDLKRVVQMQERFKGNFPGPCPVLRKDFIIDELQIAEAAAGGASAVLLIVAALGRERTKELLSATHEFGLDALVEVHDESEVEIAVEAGAEIVGVNNRDLRTFDVSLETSFRLGEVIPDSVVKVAESGIANCEDAWKLRDAGFSAVLVGESLVKAYNKSSDNTNAYSVGFNQAKGLIASFRRKGSVEYGSTTSAAFYGKGEGAKETLGELSI